MAKKQVASNYITEIKIEKLFGKYNYVISNDNSFSNDFPKLLILYGDNGSGKTTILNLIFYLLSHIRGKGHKSKVTTIPFSRVEITLANKVKIITERPNDSLVGSFYMIILDSNKDIINDFYFEPDEDNVILIGKNNELISKCIAFLKSLFELNISIISLRDDRELQMTIETIYDLDRLYKERKSERGGSTKKFGIDYYLEASIKKTYQWLKDKKIDDSKIGDKEMDTIYLEIIKNIAYKNENKIISEEKASSFIEQLIDLNLWNKSFYKYGLTANFKGKDFINIYEKADPEIKSSILNILNPYIDSIKARLYALKDLQLQIESYIETINNFYQNKKIVFTIQDGLKIIDCDKNELTPNMLSSGEKQLLLLFNNVLPIHKGKTNFILIDEPELSLNAEWQRNLVQSLINFTKNQPVQFILATHSLPILTQYDKYVSDLISC